MNILPHSSALFNKNAIAHSSETKLCQPNLLRSSKQLHNEHVEHKLNQKLANFVGVCNLRLFTKMEIDVLHSSTKTQNAKIEHFSVEIN